MSRTNGKVSIFAIAFLIYHRMRMTGERWFRGLVETNREYGRPGGAMAIKEPRIVGPSLAYRSA
jgi:hypothetical protein